ncbi:hypothetical protein BDZ45DRAFT_692876 [Acephala macrosclerotiorum]|nr:hypothetical protein BDZ45DRAFT_692876 [Acephala macrosclerotiorum]
MNESMSSRQPKERRDKAQNIVSRRTRAFVEEQNVMNPGNIQIPESRSTSGDELEAESPKGDSRTGATANAAVLFRPVVVDLGKDVSSLFSASLEEREKQVVSVLQSARLATRAKTDERPINFGEVITGVYRSSFPGEEDFNFLSTLGLKTVLSLVKKCFSPEFEAFIKQNGIRHLVIDMQGTKKVDIPDEIMHSIMEVVLEKENHPILIHCNHGKHRTGCAVAVMRHVAGWNVDSIIEEYRLYSEPKTRDCDVNYITNYQAVSLTGLFTRRAQRLRQGPDSMDERMAKFFILAAIVLSIWIITFLLW